MDGLIFGASIIAFIFWIVTLLEFFKISANVKAILEESMNHTRYLEAISANIARMGNLKK